MVLPASTAKFEWHVWIPPNDSLRRVVHDAAYWGLSYRFNVKMSVLQTVSVERMHQTPKGVGTRLSRRTSKCTMQTKRIMQKRFAVYEQASGTTRTGSH